MEVNTEQKKTAKLHATEATTKNDRHFQVTKQLYSRGFCRTDRFLIHFQRYRISRSEHKCLCKRAYKTVKPMRGTNFYNKASRNETFAKSARVRASSTDFAEHLAMFAQLIAEPSLRIR